jgi:hypothetical protein
MASHPVEQEGGTFTAVEFKKMLGFLNITCAAQNVFLFFGRGAKLSFTLQTGRLDVY